MIGGGEVFDGDGGASGAGKFGQHGAQFIEGAVKGDIFQFEGGFPTDGPEFGWSGLDSGAADEEVLFEVWEPKGGDFESYDFLVVFEIGEKSEVGVDNAGFEGGFDGVKFSVTCLQGARGWQGEDKNK